MVLSSSLTLNGRYAIQSVLGETGPYDVTYLAWDSETEQDVVIREYFPLGLARRADDRISIEVLDAELFSFGLGAFRREAELLHDIDHPNILPVTDTFQENGTTYRVSTHIDGAALTAYVRQQSDALSEEQTLMLLQSILDALEYAHETYLYHGYLSPKSIFIDEEGIPVLLNFQMARTRLAQKKNPKDPFFHTGYTPCEEINLEQKGLPAWDIYSAAATTYFMLTGESLPAPKTPVAHKEVTKTIQETALLSPHARDALINTLAFEPADRPQSIEDLRELLFDAPTMARLIENAKTFNRVEVGFAEPEPETENHWQDIIAEARDSEEALYETVATDASFEDDLEMATKQPTSQEQESSVYSNKPSYLPKRKDDTDPNLENMLAEMVKRQKRFTTMLVSFVILLLSTIVGIFLGPRLFTGGSEALPIAAEAAGETSQELIASNDAAPPEGIEPNPPEDVEAEADLVPFALEEEAEENQATLESAIEEAPALTAPVSTTSSTPQPPTQDNASPEQTATPPVSQPPANEAAEAAAEASDDEPLESSSEGESEILDEAAVAESATEDEANRISIENERQYRYLLGQGDVLYTQGQIAQALESYESALTYNPGDVDLEIRVAAMRDSILLIEHEAARAESLRVRLTKISDENGILIAPDTPAVLTNEAALYSEINYPPQARRAEVEGRVILRVVVNEDGQVEQPTIAQGIGFGCDEEALRVIEQAQFTPATFNGRPAKAWYMYSIVFALNGE